VIGGSDGQSSLSSVEIYDMSTQTWSVGPSLNTPRANVGVAVLNGRPFAIGGYNGKTFLDTVEYLMEDGHEWTLFMPVAEPAYVNGTSDATSSASDVDSKLDTVLST
jgi:influenza virus NS1A-binding protein